MVSIVLRYYLPRPIGNVYFFGILIALYLTKRNYFFIAFIFLIIHSPGFLFYPYGNYSLPGFGIAGTERSISYAELFLFVTLIKTFSIEKETKLFYKVPLTLLFIYFIFLFLISVVQDMPFLKLMKTIRMFIPFLFFYSIPRLMQTKEAYAKLFNLLFATIPILVLAQLTDIITGKYLASYFGDYVSKFAVSSGTDEVFFNPSERTVRTIYGINILLISYIMAIYYYVNKERYFSKGYLLSIISLCLLSVMLSATRGWIISFIFMLCTFLIIYFRNIVGVIKGFSLPGLLFGIVLLLFPIIVVQLTNVFQRIGTLFNLLSGDMSAGGTLIRITKRMPRVMSKFWDSPVFGYGFTEDYFKYVDGHLGHQSMLINGGIVGYSLFMIFFGYFLLKLFNLKANVSRQYKNILWIFIIGFIGIFIAHSTSTMIFSYQVSVTTGLMISLFFIFADFNYKQIRLSSRSKHKSQLSAIIK